MTPGHPHYPKRAGMSSKQFRWMAVKLFGSKRGWQQRCADALRVDKSSVSRWLSNGVSVPGPVAIAIRALSEIRKAK